MFTGIVETMGQVRHVQTSGTGARVVIGCANLDLDDVKVGDSIAVNGCCLTVVGLEPDAFHIDVSQETLAVTTGFADGEAVNLEKALRLSDRLGGHLVSGHVDARGQVTRLEPAGESWLVEIRVPALLRRYIARKGSVTLNGVSLTVNRVEDDCFEVNLIPHTMHVTNLQHLRVGSAVNLEVDLLARYLEQLVAATRQVD
jgi:riboflavin synthase